MKILLGTDLVDISRIKKLAKTTSFIDRNFSKAEIELFESKGKNVFQTIAGNFCAKEACIKAIGNYIEKYSFKEIEILRKNSGKPFIRFNGRLTPLNDKLSSQVSISHTDSIAMATVVFWKKSQTKQEK